jgi:hypothetical protein
MIRVIQVIQIFRIEQRDCLPKSLDPQTLDPQPRPNFSRNPGP